MEINMTIMSYKNLNKAESKNLVNVFQYFITKSTIQKGGGSCNFFLFNNFIVTKCDIKQRETGINNLINSHFINKAKRDKIV